MGGSGYQKRQWQNNNHPIHKNNYKPYYKNNSQRYNRYHNYRYGGHCNWGRWWREERYNSKYRHGTYHTDDDGFLMFSYCDTGVCFTIAIGD